jgi:mercuric reductase
MVAMNSINDSGRYDLVVLGSGSTAFAAALRARELGKTAVMTEGRAIGGTCVNRGCLPSKNLIEAARLIFDAAHPRYPGLKANGGLQVDFRALIAQKDEVIRDYRDKKYESLVGGEISVEEGHARFVDPHTVAVNGKRLTGGRVLIATGSRRAVPDIPGLSEIPYLTSDLLTHGEEAELQDLPESLLIVGGGYIALELGQMFARFGSRVTIVERSKQLLAHGYEPQLGRTVARIFEEEGITVILNGELNEVRSTNEGIMAVAQVAGVRRTFNAERLLIATGRRPNTNGIGLETAGVVVNDKGEVEVDANLRTRMGHIFAAGM